MKTGSNRWVSTMRRRVNLRAAALNQALYLVNLRATVRNAMILTRARTSGGHRNPATVLIPMIQGRIRLAYQLRSNRALMALRRPEETPRSSPAARTAARVQA